MVGVRYLVVSKSAIDSRGQTLVDEDVVISELGDENVLIDLGVPNLGTYSPVSVESADSLAATFEIINDDSFDATRNVIVQGDAPADLIGADVTKFEISDGDVFVSAINQEGARRC